MSRQTLWQILLTLGFAPLGVIGWMLAAVARIIDAVADIAFGVQDRWLVAVRRWSGRTPQGKTAAQVREENEHLKRTLAEMRAAKFAPWPDKPTESSIRAADHTNTLNPDPATISVERRESR